MDSETLWLLERVNTIFQIFEKVAYAILVIYIASIVKTYVSDYKDNVQKK